MTTPPLLHRTGNLLFLRKCTEHRFSQFWGACGGGCLHVAETERCSNDPWPWYFCKGIVIQMGGVYHQMGDVHATSNQEKGILVQKYSDTNGSSIALLLKYRSQGGVWLCVWGAFCEVSCMVCFTWQGPMFTILAGWFGLSLFPKSSALHHFPIFPVFSMDFAQEPPKRPQKRPQPPRVRSKISHPDHRC